MTIDGVILTKAALEQLREWQKYKNEWLQSNLDFLVELAEYISAEDCEVVFDNTQRLGLLSQLFAVGRQLKHLLASEEPKVEGGDE